VTTAPKRRRRTKAQLELARRRREAGRKANLKTRHHMTPEQYDLILAFQGGVCYICRRANGKTRALSVDHDHKKAREQCEHPHDESCRNCWRGLLCRTCNAVLGHLRDAIEALRRAIHYLKYPPAQEALIAEEGDETPG
jgi:hypothetical protein